MDFVVESLRRLLRRPEGARWPVDAEAGLTAHDWVFDPSFGFFGAAGGWLEDHGLRHVLRSWVDDCPVRRWSVPGCGLTVRFPALAVCCLVGALTGLAGTAAFRRRSFYCLSFAFFAAMNAAALVFHVFLAPAAPCRAFPLFVDHAATGLSGSFLGIALLESAGVVRTGSRLAALCIPLFILAVLALCTVRAAGEAAYLSGCASALCGAAYVGVTGARPRDEAVSAALTVIVRWCAGIAAVFAASVVGARAICSMSHGYITLLELLFTASDIGFIVVLSQAKRLSAPSKEKDA
ncbi:hypothetical protein DIPPA_05060 [Diplonema papillatum]|nr:hypothetical protein DIPPA_05060 [Diplonema papillatum]